MPRPQPARRSIGINKLRSARPSRLVVVGGGRIGCETAQAFARLGSRVTIVSHDAQLLPREDAHSARLLTAVFAREGIDLRVGATLTRASRAGTTRVLTISRDGRDETLEADEILVAIGRAPNVEGLGLDSAGVTPPAPAWRWTTSYARAIRGSGGNSDNRRSATRNSSSPRGR